MDNVIETFSLTKRFSSSSGYRSVLRFGRQEDLTAVDEVTLQVREGELFGLLGPNGAGKTTLIKMLCTLVLPSSGRASVCGADVLANAGVVKRSIGMVDGQERSFFWRLSGRQNLEFFAALHGLRGADADRRIAELLQLVGLGEHADRRVTGYSTGMRQKLSIVRGLLTTPKVLFLDEPTRSLDPVVARDLRAFIRDTLVVQLGYTVVLVTHHLEEAEELCDRVAIMNHGQIIACGPVAEIKRSIPSGHRYRLQVQYLPSCALADLRAIPGVEDLQCDQGNLDSLHLDLLLTEAKETLPPVMRFIVGQGAAIQHCEAEGLSLEEAFVHLTRGDEDGL
jgi:ABC-2 type transport system ATP-binding protein